MKKGLVSLNRFKYNNAGGHEESTNSVQVIMRSAPYVPPDNGSIQNKSRKGHSGINELYERSGYNNQRTLPENQRMDNEVKRVTNNYTLFKTNKDISELFKFSSSIPAANLNKNQDTYNPSIDDKLDTDQNDKYLDYENFDEYEDNENNFNMHNMAFIHDNRPSANDYLEKRHLQAQEKLERIKEDKNFRDTKEVTLKPKIGSRSNMLSEKKSHMNVFNRLTNTNEARRKQEEIQRIESLVSESFKPHINQKSMNMKRSIKDLYEWKESKDQKRSKSVRNFVEKDIKRTAISPRNMKQINFYTKNTSKPPLNTSNDTRRTKIIKSGDDGYSNTRMGKVASKSFDRGNLNKQVQLEARSHKSKLHSFDNDIAVTSSVVNIQILPEKKYNEPFFNDKNNMNKVLFPEKLQVDLKRHLKINDFELARLNSEYCNPLPSSSIEDLIIEDNYAKVKQNTQSSSSKFIRTAKENNQASNNFLETTPDNSVNILLKKVNGDLSNDTLKSSINEEELDRYLLLNYGQEDSFNKEPKPMDFRNESYSIGEDNPYACDQDLNQIQTLKKKPIAENSSKFGFLNSGSIELFKKAENKIQERPAELLADSNEKLNAFVSMRENLSSFYTQKKQKQQEDIKAYQESKPELSSTMNIYKRNNAVAGSFTNSSVKTSVAFSNMQAKFTNNAKMPQPDSTSRRLDHRIIERK